MKTVGVLEKIVETHKFKKIFFLCICKMADISVKNNQIAKVKTITVDIKKLFWIRMIDVQNGIDAKNV